ncbi:hypothetical protein OG21DRAFT_1427548, partial [Imleria badia]
YDPSMISKGLFRGFLIERVLKHIFTSPSSALSKRVKGARAGNAKIHRMQQVEVEHIAYAAIQARFIILSAEKWTDQDALFNYQDYYYRIICLIRETKDQKWASELLSYYNKYVADVLKTIH